MWVWNEECVDMTSDASGTWGLGASFGDLVLQREWTEEESNLSIFHKELLAFVEALTAWAPLMQHRNVLAWIDNQGAVSVLRKKSGPIEIGYIIHKVNALLIQYDIRLRWAYIPTKLNVLADLLSRGGATCAPPVVILDQHHIASLV
jgi:hypothetical protein